MLGKIAIQWGLQDPPRAADFAAGALASGGNQENALVKIVRCWGSAAPEPAGAWVEKIPDDNLRAAVSQSLIEVWARNDPGKAGEWLNRLPPNRSRDAAAGAYATVLAANSPEKAAQIAATIQDEPLRARVMTRLRGP
jgi:hypothetical protein